MPDVGEDADYERDSSPPRDVELFTWRMQERLKELFPGVAEVGGEAMVDGRPARPTPDSQRAFAFLAMQELGLEPYAIDDTLRDTVNSYYKLS